MKNLTKIVASLAITSMAAAASSTASAEVSYNIGFASEYYYRGILQKESSASAGIDYEEGGFSVGAWTADVGEGLEYDIYGAYGIETTSGFTASIGVTGYYYTGEFDDTYEEVNFNFGYGIIAVEYSLGQWEGFGAGEDYDFLAITLAGESGIYATYGSFGDDFDGDYIEVGYGTSIADFDVGVAAIFNSDELSDQTSSTGSKVNGEAFVFNIGKSF